VSIAVYSPVFNDNNEEDITAIKRELFIVVDFAGTVHRTVITCSHKIAAMLNESTKPNPRDRDRDTKYLKQTSKSRPIFCPRDGHPNFSLDTVSTMQNRSLSLYSSTYMCPAHKLLLHAYQCRSICPTTYSKYSEVK